MLRTIAFSRTRLLLIFQMSTQWGMVQGWLYMSLLMMGPIALYLILRHSVNLLNATASFSGFALVWILAAVPVNLFHLVTNEIHFAYVAVLLWTIAGAHQFSRQHNQSLLSCMKVIPSNNFKSGISLGWNCLVACGPLMVAMMWTLPMSFIVMIPFALVMFLEVASAHRVIISRVLGLASGIYAVGILFLSAPTVEMGEMVLKHQH